MTSIRLCRDHYVKSDSPSNKLLNFFNDAKFLVIKKPRKSDEAEKPGPSNLLQDENTEIGKDGICLIILIIFKIIILVTELRSRICRFQAGCYTLVDDQIIENKVSDGIWLDVNLCFSSYPKEWPEEFGGYTSYFDRNNFDEEDVSFIFIFYIMCKYDSDVFLV